MVYSKDINMINLGATMRTKETPTMSIDHHPRTHQSGPEEEPKSTSTSLLDRFRTKTVKRVAGAAGVLAVGAAGFGLSKLGGGEGHDTSPQATHSVPAPTPSELPSAIPTTPEATASTPNTEPIAITIDYKKFESLTPAEFATHTYDEKAQYAIVQYEDVETTGALYKEFEPEREELPWLTEYSPVRMPLHEFSDAKDMELQALFTQSMVKSRKANIHDEAPGPVDKAEAEKLLPGYALPGTPAFKGMIKTIEGMTEEGTAAAVESASATSITILKQTAGVRDVDGDGKSEKIRTIIMSDGTNAWTVVRAFKPNARLTEIAQAKGETREAGLWPAVSIEKSKVTVS
jgi:hypothetical protein